MDAEPGRGGGARLKVVCVGLVVCDVLLRPVPGDIMSQDACRVSRPVMAKGGDAANVAVALSKLGARASLAGFVGADANGDFVVSSLAEQGVDVSAVRRHPSMGTVVSYVLVEEGGQRHFVVYGELNGALTDKDIPDALLDGADVVYFGSCAAMEGMDNGGAAALFRKARGRGILTMADATVGARRMPAERWQALLAPMLRETDVFAPSYGEAAAISGREDLAGIREAFAPFGLKLLVVKLGERGVYLTDFREEWEVPAFDCFPVVDTTGAGDTFVAGLIRGWLEGWPWPAAAAFACGVAGHNITQVGATGGAPDFDTAYRFIVSQKGAAGYPLRGG